MWAIRSQKERLRDGKKVSLKRTPKSSPEFLEKHSLIDDLISFEVFDSEEKQTARVVEGIVENLNTDELLPDDIIVINPDPLKTKKAVGAAREMPHANGREFQFIRCYKSCR